jgi:hypothetical protein
MRQNVLGSGLTPNRSVHAVSEAVDLRLEGAMTAVISVRSHAKRDYRQLQQIIAGLAEGVILVDVNQRILWQTMRRSPCMA